MERLYRKSPVKEREEVGVPGVTVLWCGEIRAGRLARELEKGILWVEYRGTGRF